ncbi:paeninodin family lasso peptide [Paenibacillus aurantiacus]|uniref:Paeninodin family lasso peptide n=1 Tax=Paenibacillus aurantiacus TaxID=1936118 RepID=A0ABV5KLD5_9BACL
MKKQWNKPTMEALSVQMTMAGPGEVIPDAVQPDPTEIIHFES